MSNATMEGVSRIDNTIDELKLEGPWEDQNQKLIFYRGNSETFKWCHIIFRTPSFNSENLKQIVCQAGVGL